jgi:hypothetical protein
LLLHKLLTLGFSGGFIKSAALAQKSGDAVEQRLPRSVRLDIASQTGVTPEVQAQIAYVHAKKTTLRSLWDCASLWVVNLVTR